MSEARHDLTLTRGGGFHVAACTCGWKASALQVVGAHLAFGKHLITTAPAYRPTERLAAAPDSEDRQAGRALRGPGSGSESTGEAQ